MTLTTDYPPALAAPVTTGTLFRFATAGSVDDGKSTLVGRLLHDSKSILVDQLEAVTRTSIERGFGGDSGAIDLALFTDGLRAEREQGITIDVAYRYFTTGRRSFILADCPGHVQYTRNMVTGATTADAVIVLVDARKGVLEQTRRHLSVLALLRVPHVIVAVNKIDLLGFAEGPIVELTADLLAVTDELGLQDVRVVPVSALDGDNVVERSERTPWYTGETLLDLLETLPTTDEHEAGEARRCRLPAAGPAGPPPAGRRVSDHCGAGCVPRLPRVRRPALERHRPRRRCRRRASRGRLHGRALDHRRGPSRSPKRRLRSRSRWSWSTTSTWRAAR